MTRKLILVTIFTITVLALFGLPLNYIQKVVAGDPNVDIYQIVTNTSTATSDQFIVEADILETPGEIMTTEPGNPDGKTSVFYNNLRINRVATNVVTTAQCGWFPTPWVAGNTIQITVKYIGTAYPEATGQTVTFTQVIPENPGSSIMDLVTPEIVPPLPTGGDDQTLTITSEPTGQPIWMDGADTGFTTPHDFVNPAVGSVFTINNSLYTWNPANYTVPEGFVTATVHFVGTLVPDTFTYNLYVNGPDGYAVTGPVAGTTDYLATNADVTALVGAYTIAAAPENYHWEINPINVVATDFVEQPGGKNAPAFGSRSNGAKAHRIFNHTIEFVLVPNPPITYTVNVAGPAGYSVNGVDFPAVFTDSNDYTNDLIGTVLTPSAAPAGYHWEPADITVAAADFENNVANYAFQLVEDAPQAFTFEVNAFDLDWYNDNGYVFPTNVPAFNDPNDVHAQILLNGNPFNPPIYTPYIFGAPGNEPFVAGEYTVTHPAYDNDLWLPESLTFVTINNDYAADFLGTEPVIVTPVELSSFSATLTANLYVKLTWVSQTETNMQGYKVYRGTSADFASAEMLDIPMVPATNTSSTATYTVTDSNVLANNTYYYWLESIDYNQHQFFGPTSVFVESVTPPVTDHTRIVKSGPNPFKIGDTYDIELNVKTGETGTVTIYNVIGQVVRTYSVTGGTGQHVKWDGKDSRGNACGSGIYFFKLSTPTTNQSKKIVVVK